MNLLVNACRARLEATRLSREVKLAGTDALIAAQHANVVRNSIVHDIWLRSTDGGQGDEAN